MPIIAILHSPFYPTDVPGEGLHYYCDILKVTPGTCLHHHEALVLIQEDNRSMPVFGADGRIVTMGAAAWRERLALLRGRVLFPGDSLQIRAGRERV